MGFWFSCKHKHVSTPHLKRSEPDAKHAAQEYVVECLDCNKTLAYTPSPDERRLLQAVQHLERKTKDRRMLEPPQEMRPASSKPQAGVGAMPLVALHRLATLHHSRKNYVDAEAIYRDVLRHLHSQGDVSGVDLDQVLANFATLLAEEKRYAEAEETYKKAIRELLTKEGDKCPKLVRRMAALGELYLTMGDALQAQKQFERALLLADEVLPPEHADLMRALRGYAAALRKGNRIANAVEIEERINKIEHGNHSTVTL